MSELADEADSKSVDGNIVRVQVPPPAAYKYDGFGTKPSYFFYVSKALWHKGFYRFYIIK